MNLPSTLTPTALHALMALAALLAVPVIALRGSADLARSLRREFLLGITLWDFAAARDCLAV